MIFTHAWRLRCWRWCWWWRWKVGPMPLIFFSGCSFYTLSLRFQSWPLFVSYGRLVRNQPTHVARAKHPLHCPSFWLKSCDFSSMCLVWFLIDLFWGVCVIVWLIFTLKYTILFIMSNENSNVLPKLNGFWTKSKMKEFEFEYFNKLKQFWIMKCSGNRVRKRITRVNCNEYERRKR